MPAWALRPTRFLLALLLLIVGTAELHATQIPHCVPAQNTTSKFWHPGILMNCADLMSLHKRVAARSTDNAQPNGNHYYTGWEQMMTNLENTAWSNTATSGTITSGQLDDPNYVTHAQKIIECGTATKTNAADECWRENYDALAAYALALKWFIYGNDTYALASIRIMKAWTDTMVDSDRVSVGGSQTYGCDAYDPTTDQLGSWGLGALRSGGTDSHGNTSGVNFITAGHAGTNAPLQSAWVATLWARTAEIIRYTYTGWSVAGRQSMINMLATCYLPNLRDNWSKRAYITGAGNWELSKADAEAAIAVFSDNVLSDQKGAPLTADIYQEGVDTFNNRVPSYIYQTSDGSYPIPLPESFTLVHNLDGVPVGGVYPSSTFAIDDQRKTTCLFLNRNAYDSSCPSSTLTTHFANGQAQETCRDTLHLGLAYSAIFSLAETSRIQEDKYAALYPGVAPLSVLYKQRLVDGLEYHAQIITNYDWTKSSTGGAWTNPDGTSFCSNVNPSPGLKAASYEPTYEAAFNSLTNRPCDYGGTSPSLPNLSDLLARGLTSNAHNAGERYRENNVIPQTAPANPALSGPIYLQNVERMVFWEEATHANMYSLGLPSIPQWGSCSPSTVTNGLPNEPTYPLGTTFTQSQSDWGLTPLTDP